MLGRGHCPLQLLDLLDVKAVGKYQRLAALAIAICSSLGLEVVRQLEAEVLLGDGVLLLLFENGDLFLQVGYFFIQLVLLDLGLVYYLLLSLIGCLSLGIKLLDLLIEVLLELLGDVVELRFGVSHVLLMKGAIDFVVELLGRLGMCPDSLGLEPGFLVCNGGFELLLLVPE